MHAFKDSMWWESYKVSEFWMQLNKGKKKGKAKTHSSVSRHLSTRISDRPIDAFVSFYPSDTAAVLPACPIWHLSVFFLLYRWRSDPTVQPAFYLFLFFLEAVVSFPPFILVSMAASWRGGRPHEEAAPGELRGSSRGRRGEGPGDPRGLSQGAARRMCEGGGDMRSLRFVLAALQTLPLHQPCLIPCALLSSCDFCSQLL